MIKSRMIKLNSVRQQRGSILFAGMLGIAICLVLITLAYGLVSHKNQEIYLADRRDQADLLAVEGVRMAYAYMKSVQNHDRVDGWKSIVDPLSGVYSFKYSAESGYEVSQGRNETITLVKGETPYVRTTRIEDKDGGKSIVCTVSPGRDQEPVVKQAITFNEYGK